MKANLYKVQQGRKWVFMLAYSKADADESCGLKAMGSRETTLIGEVEFKGNEIEGVTSYNLNADGLPCDFVRHTHEISHNIYEELCDVGTEK